MWPQKCLLLTFRVVEGQGPFGVMVSMPLGYQGSPVSSKIRIRNLMKC